MSCNPVLTNPAARLTVWWAAPGVLLQTHTFNPTTGVFTAEDVAPGLVDIEALAGTTSVAVSGAAPQMVVSAAGMSVASLKALGAGGSPKAEVRAEFHIGDLRVASITPAGELTVPDVTEAATGDEGVFFFFVVGGIVRAALRGSGLFATAVVETG